LLDRPAAAISARTAHLDDIGVLALATLLRTPGTGPDRVIGAALRTRGVIGARRSTARSELAAQVVARTVTDQRSRVGRRSAFERVCRWPALRDLVVDHRPVAEILNDARVELAGRKDVIARGLVPQIGAATIQIALRGAIHLIFSPALGTPLLRRSTHGAGKGEASEPAEVLRALATSPRGLEQLAQAIFDGRDGRVVQLLEEGRTAHRRPESMTDGPVPNPPDDADAGQPVTDSHLWEIASVTVESIPDPTAGSKVAQDTIVLHGRVASLNTVVERIWSHRDHDSDVPYVEDSGWADPHGCVDTLTKIVKRLENGVSNHQFINRTRRPAVDETPLRFVDGDS
jgi:hypothetical protein